MSNLSLERRSLDPRDADDEQRFDIANWAGVACQGAIANQFEMFAAAGIPFAGNSAFDEELILFPAMMTMKATSWDWMQPQQAQTMTTIMTVTTTKTTVTATDSCNHNRTAIAQKLRSAKVKDKIIVDKHFSDILSKWIDSYHIYGQMIVFFDSYMIILYYHY